MINTINKILANDKMLTASKIVMGSNIDSNNNLKTAALLLQKIHFIKEIILINEHISQDYKKISNLLYHNQGFLVYFNQEISFLNFNTELKNIEKMCNRTDNEIGEITIDIDILQVNINNTWYCIFERLPFKEHELICLNKDLL